MTKFKKRFVIESNQFRIVKIYSYGMAYEAFCKGFVNPENLIGKTIKLVDCGFDIEQNYQIINASNNVISYAPNKYVKRTYITLASYGNFVDEIYRQIRFSIQRLMRGFDGSALWNLDTYLTDLLVKIFKRFRRAAEGHGWPILDKNKNVVYVDGGKISQQILDGFLLLQKTNNDYSLKLTQHENEMINHSFNLFCKYFHNFWT